MAKKKWERPLVYKRFGGVTYKLENSARSKRGANSIAKKYRNQGHPARVVKAKDKGGKVHYLIYTK